MISMTTALVCRCVDVFLTVDALAKMDERDLRVAPMRGAVENKCLHRHYERFLDILRLVFVKYR